MENVMSMISTVGFPIVCCIFMWRFISTTMKDFTKTVDDNTRVIDKLCEKLERGDIKHE